MKKASKELACDCLCSDCRPGDVCHYSSYHCKHPEEMGLEKGSFESHGFCMKTGYMPDSSWRHHYLWPGQPPTEVAAVENQLTKTQGKLANLNHTIDQIRDVVDDPLWKPNVLLNTIKGIVG